MANVLDALDGALKDTTTPVSPALFEELESGLQIAEVIGQLRQDLGDRLYAALDLVRVLEKQGHPQPDVTTTLHRVVDALEKPAGGLTTKQRQRRWQATHKLRSGRFVTQGLES